MIRSYLASVMVVGLLTGGGGCEGCSGCTSDSSLQGADDDSAQLPCDDCTPECPTPPECPECEECPTPEECPECPDPECPTSEPTPDDNDMDSYDQVNVQSGTVMVAPSGTTQANAWVQVQCPDDVDLLDCREQDVVMRSVRVWSLDAGEFEPAQDFCPGTDLEQDVWWSMEFQLRGVNNNVSGGGVFRSPQDGAFALHPDCGLQFMVPTGWYASPMSCDIDEACDFRTAEAGAQYYWDVEVCRLPNVRYPDHELVFRLGFDWLSCRGGQCSDGNDDWIAEIHTPWFDLPDRTCVHVSP